MLECDFGSSRFLCEKQGNYEVAFLNVLQGNTPDEAATWYEAVKKFSFEGWAFAGPLRHNFYYLCDRLLRMADEGELQNKKWIHVLGTCELFVAVLLTALQRAINKHINPKLRISFDTSSPFRNIAYGNAYPHIDNLNMSMPTRPIPDHYDYIGTHILWPWPSPLGDRMTMGDICQPRKIGREKCRDTQAEAYIAHHNLAALCWGVAFANRVFDSDNITHKHSFGWPVGAATEAIEEIFKSQSFEKLEYYKGTFGALPHNADTSSDDDERRRLV